MAADTIWLLFIAASWVCILAAVVFTELCRRKVEPIYGAIGALIGCAGAILAAISFIWA